MAPSKMVRLFIVCAAVMAGLASGCGSNARAPVEDRVNTPPPEVTVESHQRQSRYRVQRGDTLYSIAFRYGLDFRKMAAANGIPSPYTIYVGQALELREASIAASPAPAQVRASPKPPASAAGNPPVAPSSDTGQRTQSKPGPEPAAEPQFAGATVGAWRWPTKGKVTRGYSRSVHAGIDIDGERGDSVMAVADGEVVYAGTGIVGFGELLILKHNDIYLSAYGHNDRLLVAEGQVVSAGEQIARKGSSGTDTVKLHFEIRKEGKPVDPQRLLPRR